MRMPYHFPTSGNPDPYRLEADIAAIEKALSFRGALVVLTSDQAIAASTFTDIEWDAISYDTDAMWDSDDATKLTVPAGVGYVRLTGAVEWSTSFTESVGLNLQKNASSDDGLPVARATGASGGGTQIITPVIKVTPGDDFTFRVFQANAASKSLKSGDTTFFAMELVD